MQVHEITRSAFVNLLRNLSYLEYASEKTAYDVLHAEYVTVGMPCKFGRVCKYGAVITVHSSLLDAIDMTVLVSKREAKIGIAGAINVLFGYEVWHVVDDERPLHVGCSCPGHDWPNYPASETILVYQDAMRFFCMLGSFCPLDRRCFHLSFSDNTALSMVLDGRIKVIPWR